MVKFTIQQIRQMMDSQSNIRNVSIIAHVDHGKTTLTDSLIAKAGIISDKEAGNKCYTDTDKTEQERGITIKSTGVSLFYTRDKRKNVEEKESFLINLIDSPGHVDFSTEVTAALRVTDGALVVVDCVESVCVQTETVLRQAISEQIRPVLFLNKVDRIFLELNKDLEQTYQDFCKTIQSANDVINSCFNDGYVEEKENKMDGSGKQKTDMTQYDNLELNPIKGNVGFGSGYHAWAFTLRDFAQIYGPKWQKKGLQMKPEKVMKKLWGENYWDQEEGKFVESNPGGKLKRTFVQFVLEPIQQLIKSALTPNRENLEIVLESLDISGKLKKDAWDLKGRDFVKAVMSSWLPAGDALLDMMAESLPSPADAQKYRVNNLFTGPKDSELANAIRNCDPKGPVVMYISKMIPSGQGSNFTAFGRVFSGTVESGKEIRILDSSYDPENWEKSKVVRMTKCVVFQAAKEEGAGTVPCGNLCGVGGVSKFMLKSGTLVDPNIKSPYPIIPMKFSVAPVVRVAVSPKDPNDLQLLAKGLKSLSQTDQLVRIFMDQKTSQNIIAGAGELHLQICLKDLSEKFMNGAKIIVSPPVVSYSETITTKCGDDGIHPTRICAKSGNKLNRFYVDAQPLDEDLVKDIEKDLFKVTGDSKKVSKILQSKYSWDKDSTKRIWSWGPTPETRNNVLVDMTKGVPYLQEAKANIIQAFVEVCLGGVLCGEQLKGVRFNIIDAKIHPDPPHRNSAQIIPTLRRAFNGAMIACGPRFMEPMFQVDITAPRSEEQTINQLISKRRGEVDYEYASSLLQGVASDVTSAPTGGLLKVRAYLPVSETFASKKLNRADFTSDLRGVTKGKAFPQTSFSHWQLIKSDPMEKGTQSNKIMMDVRERKRIKLEVPDFKSFHDRL